MLNVNRSTVYHKKQPIKSTDLELIRLIDELYMKKPISGSRTIRNDLRRPGHKVNRKRVQRLTRLMGIEAIYPKPKTSRPHPQHKVYPYFLRNPDINRPNQVWAADITYIPMSRGSMYLVAIMDWHNRKVLSSRLSKTWVPILAPRRSKWPWSVLTSQRYSTPGRPVHQPGLHRPTQGV